MGIKSLEEKGEKEHNIMRLCLLYNNAWSIHGSLWYLYEGSEYFIVTECCFFKTYQTYISELL